MSYDDALRFAFAAIERLTDQRPGQRYKNHRSRSRRLLTAHPTPGVAASTRAPLNTLSRYPARQPSRRVA
jgi:hypothetical protein